jgi:hypothetical protein
VAAEADRTGPLGPRDLPGIAGRQPLVGPLDLPAVHDLLIEDPELVADAVADRRHLERRQRIEEARGEAAEAAVAEPRLLFLRHEIVVVEPEVGDGVAELPLDAEVEDVVGQVRADEELRGEVGDDADVALDDGARGRHPVVDEAIADDVRHREIPVLWRRLFGQGAPRVEQVIDDGAGERIGHGSHRT